MNIGVGVVIRLENVPTHKMLLYFVIVTTEVLRIPSEHCVPGQ